MAKFYGTLKGACANKTSTGTEKSGLCAAAQSYDGSVIVNMYINYDGETCVSVGTAPGSSSMIEDELFFTGTLAEFKELLKLNHELRNGGASVVHHRKK